MTLIGQDVSYWSGGRVNEASPAYYFLKTSPWLFVACAVLWFVFLFWLFKKLKEPINLFLTILFIAGHSWGSTSWLWNIAKRNNLYTPFNQSSVIMVWFLVILYFALIALFASYSLWIYFKRNK